MFVLRKQEFKSKPEILLFDNKIAAEFYLRKVHGDIVTDDKINQLIENSRDTKIEETMYIVGPEVIDFRVTEQPEPVITNADELEFFRDVVGGKIWDVYAEWMNERVQSHIEEVMKQNFHPIRHIDEGQ